MDVIIASATSEIVAYDIAYTIDMRKSSISTELIIAPATTINVFIYSSLYYTIVGSNRTPFN